MSLPFEMQMSIANITQGLEYWLENEVFKTDNIKIDRITFEEKAHFKIELSTKEEKQDGNS